MTSPDSLCGPELRACICHKAGAVVRTEAQRRALHAAAVARATREKHEPTLLRILTEEERRAAYTSFLKRQARRGAA